MKLKEFFEKNNKVALGFSGGVDSTYILYAAVKYGADVKAYYVKTQFQPQFELDDAFDAAAQIGTSFELIEYDALQDEEVASNDDKRCYYCKRRIFGIIADRASKDGYAMIIDGTNASDDEADRPGMQALKELHVMSPLKLCGLTKADIRRLSEEAGLKTWNKPAYSCLATRVKPGEKLTHEKLRKIEAGEGALMKLGFTDFRLRLSGKEARLKVKPEQMRMAYTRQDEIKISLEGLFDDIFLDPEAR